MAQAPQRKFKTYLQFYYKWTLLLTHSSDVPIFSWKILINNGKKSTVNSLICEANVVCDDSSNFFVYSTLSLYSLNKVSQSFTVNLTLDIFPSTETLM